MLSCRCEVEESKEKSSSEGSQSIVVIVERTKMMKLDRGFYEWADYCRRVVVRAKHKGHAVEVQTEIRRVRTDKNCFPILVYQVAHIGFNLRYTVECSGSPTDEGARGDYMACMSMEAML